MPFIDINIEVSGAKEIARRLEVAGDQLDDMRTLAPDLFAVLSEDAFERFKSGMRHGGKAWPPNSPAYEKRKRQLHALNPGRYPGTTKGELTGRLASSLILETRDSVRRKGQDFVVWGTRVPHATVLPKRGRAPIAVSRSGVAAVQEVIRDHAVGAIRAGVKGADDFFRGS